MEGLVSRQQFEVMSQAEAGKQCVDGADLDAGPTTGVSQCGRLDVIVTVRDNQRQCGKALDDLIARAWAGESLQELLEDETRGVHRSAALKGGEQSRNLGNVGGRVAPQSE